MHTSSPFSHHAKQGAKISHSAKLSAKLDSRCEFLILRCENFASVGHIFEALSGAQIMHTIYCFEAWEVRNPVLQTVHDLDLKRRSYGHFKTDGAEYKNAPSFKNGLRNSHFDYKMISKLQNGLLKCFYFSMVYKNVFLFPLAARHGLQARNSLQATK